MKVKFKPIHYKVAGGEFPLPKQMTAGAAGADVCAAMDFPITVPARGRKSIPCGFAMEIPEGYECQIRPRSGLAKKGIMAAFGTIDSDYRGPVGVNLLNLSDKPYTVKPGDRIAQILFAPCVKFEIEIVEELSDTERGTGGYGSTGK